MLERLVTREIDYLWGRLARATRRLDSLTPLWSRGGDSRVVRVVESAGYVFARVREKLEDDLPELSHPLVASALPESLRATPSATIAHVADPSRARRSTVETGTLRLESAPVDGAPCVFETSWPITLAPIALTHAALRTPEPGLQTLSLQLEPYGASPLPDPLRIFIASENPFHALDVVHALRASRAPIQVRALGARGEILADLELPIGSIRWPAVDGPFRLFPGLRDRFASGTMLRALHAFPEVFAFFEVTGLSALSRVAPRARVIEVTVRLNEAVSEDVPIAFLLDCAPAVNVFSAVAAPLGVRGLGDLGQVQVAGHPGAEVFDLRRAGFRSVRDPGQEAAVRLWERDVAREIADGDLYLRVERRAAVGPGPMEMHATLLRPNPTRGAPSPVGELHAELLATDGPRTQRLLAGDLAGRDGTSPIANVTRVTPYLPPRLDARLPWRVNAFARMPVMQLASAAALASYVEIHDPRGVRAPPPETNPASVGFVAVDRRTVHRVERDEVVHGEEIDVALDETCFGGRGATWLVGEIVARAVAERADRLRFTRVRRVDTQGSLITDYERRNGERLPPPFG